MHICPAFPTYLDETGKVELRPNKQSLPGQGPTPTFTRWGQGLNGLRSLPSMGPHL